MPNRAILDDPGYTPSRKELGMVFDWLLGGDEPTSKAAERALVSAGATAIEPALGRLEAAQGEERVRLARFLGRLAQTNDDVRLSAQLLGLLGDSESKVIRAAAVAIGKLPPDVARRLGAEAALLEGLPLQRGAERRAFIESLGKVGGEPALEALSALDAEGDIEAQLLQRAKLRLGRATVELTDGDSVRLDVEVGHPCNVAVLHRRGLSEIVAQQLRKIGPTVAVGTDVRLLRDYRGSLSRLFDARSMLVPAVVLELERPRDVAAWADVIVEALCQNFVLDLLERSSSTKPRLRFVLPKEGHQRALLWEISERLAARTDRVQAHPRAALWEIEVDRGRAPRLLIVPKRFVDPRFGYRVREISGASHPTIAAALAEVLRPTGDDVIWDPFVGSGLELVECAMRGPYRELIGTDNSSRSLEAARANVESAKLERVRLLNADARTAHLNGVTAIVTNPPLGIRHQRDGQLGPLLFDFLANARRVLSPSGRLVWLSPFGRRTAEHARSLGFQVEQLGPVDVGGLSPELQVLRLGSSR